MHASNPETIYSAGSGDWTQARSAALVLARPLVSLSYVVWRICHCGDCLKCNVRRCDNRAKVRDEWWPCMWSMHCSSVALTCASSITTNGQLCSLLVAAIWLQSSFSNLFIILTVKSQPIVPTIFRCLGPGPRINCWLYLTLCWHFWTLFNHFLFALH